MAPRPEAWLRYLRSQQRGIASLAVTALLASGLLVASRSLEPDGAPVAGSFVSDGDDLPATLDPGDLPEGARVRKDGTVVLPDGTVLVPQPDGTFAPKPRPTPTIGNPVETAMGVTDDTIEIVYYWKGERTQTSPFVKGTAAEGANLDEEQAFNAYVDYINKHADGGGTFFGMPFNLHGRKLVTRVLAPKDAAAGDFAYAQIAEQIAKEIKPFAAVASHGSLSSYICPYIAKFGVFNLQTYDLGGKGGTLVERTDGKCVPAGLTWERQVDLTVAYLKKHMLTPYGAGEPRKYGVIYTVYPGLKDVGEAMVRRLKDEGIPVVAHARLPDSLAQGQQEAQGILLDMREKGVNTLIMPDAGAPLTITHAAQAQGYKPDYYVWPCSGTDVTGMVRLFNGAQWQGAEGLTCYDREFNPDAVNNDFSRKSEWWKAYKEVRPGGGDPPAPSPLVYAGMYQLLAGITLAGPNLTPHTFSAALNDFTTYRYDTVDGRTDDPTNMLLTLGAADRSFIGDVAFLEWSTLASEGGAQGAYLYPEDRRYRTEADF